MRDCKGRNQMDWSKIVWEKVFETRLWVFINLVLPLCVFPIAASCYWLKRQSIPWLKIVREGQLCFYAVAILAASGYEVQDNWSQPYVAAMTLPLFIAGAFAVLYFGLIFADGNGNVGHTKQFDDSRVVCISTFIAVTSVFVAWLTHAFVKGAYR
jgi:hypothetical protein